MVGLPLEVAPGRIGLESQYYCTADPSAWYPIGGKNPVHTAGKVHMAALESALNRENYLSRMR